MLTSINLSLIDGVPGLATLDKGYGADEAKEQFELGYDSYTKRKSSARKAFPLVNQPPGWVRVWKLSGFFCSRARDTTSKTTTLKPLAVDQLSGVPNWPLGKLPHLTQTLSWEGYTPLGQMIGLTQSGRGRGLPKRVLTNRSRRCLSVSHIHCWRAYQYSGWLISQSFPDRWVKVLATARVPLKDVSFTLWRQGVHFE